MVNIAKVIRFLGLLRIWRVVRLVNGIIANEEAKHEETKKLLESQHQVGLCHVNDRFSHFPESGRNSDEEETSRRNAPPRNSIKSSC